MEDVSKILLELLRLSFHFSKQEEVEVWADETARFVNIHLSHISWHDLRAVLSLSNSSNYIKVGISFTVWSMEQAPVLGE